VDDQKMWGIPHVLGIPLKQWVAMSHLEKKNRSLVPSEIIHCSDNAVIINPTEISYMADPQYNYQIFFEASGTFELPAANGVSVILRGGNVSMNGYFDPPLCCIGADDRLIIEINDTVVVNYDLSSANYHFLDPFDNGIDVTPYVHPGENTYHAKAFDTQELSKYVPPLRLTVQGAATKLLVRAGKDTVRHAEDLFVVSLATDTCNNQRPFDDNTLLTYTVTSGSEYGCFMNAAGDTFASPMTNVLYIDAANNGIKFFANGVIPDSVAPVTIRVSANQFDITPGEVQFYVDQPLGCAITTLNPSRLTAGDTATVTLMQQMYDGSVRDFKPSQLFSVSILEGAGNGYILTMDDQVSETGFDYTWAGFKYIAPESFSADSLVVHLIVIPQMSAPAKTVHTNVDEEINNQMSEENLKKKMRQLMDDACAPGEVTVKNDACSTSPSCNGQTEEPTLDYSVKPNGFANINLDCKVFDDGKKELGGFKPLDANTTDQFGDYDFQICFSGQGLKVHSVSLHINVIKALCTQNFGQGQAVINNTQEMIDFIKFPPINYTVCCARSDVQGYQYYPVHSRSTSPILLEAENQHEYRHLQDYSLFGLNNLEVCKELEKISALEIPCKDPVTHQPYTKDEAKAEFNNIIYGKLKLIATYARDGYYNYVGDEDSARRETYEQDVQSDVYSNLVYLSYWPLTLRVQQNSILPCECK
jgi:hypothetical protein